MIDADILIKRFVDQIRTQIESNGLELEDAVDAVKGIARDFALPEENLRYIDAAAERYSKERDQVEYLRVTALRRRDREPWYPGPQENDVFWPVLKDFLLNDKGWNKNIKVSEHIFF